MKQILLLFLLLLSTQLEAQEIKIGTADTVYSKILHENRPLKIFLPATYHQYHSNQYPVIYILDGDFLFHAASGLIEHMSKTGQIPESVVVCISNTNRTRDFTPTRTTINYEGIEDQGLSQSGGGMKFLDFLNEELIPHINQRFRTNSFNTIVGRSFGGLIGGIDYLEERSKINAYLLIDPSFWWDQQLMIHEINQQSISALIKNKKLYLSCSDNYDFSNDIALMRNSQELVYAQLKNKGVPNSNIKIDYFEEETHGTVTIPSLRKGLLFIYHNFYLKGMKYQSADKIVDHFYHFSKTNQAQFYPLEGMINWLASIQREKDEQGVLQLYQLNAKNYPESVNAKLNLAKFYLSIDDQQKAIDQLNLVLELDEENKTAIELINEIKK